MLIDTLDSDLVRSSDYTHSHKFLVNGVITTDDDKNLGEIVHNKPKTFNYLIYSWRYNTSGEFQDAEQRIKSVMNARPMPFVVYHSRYFFGHLIICLNKSYSYDDYSIISKGIGDMVGFDKFSGYYKKQDYNEEIPLPTFCKRDCSSDGLDNTVSYSEIEKNSPHWAYLLDNLPEFLKMKIGPIPTNDRILRAIVSFMKSIVPERKAMDNLRTELRPNGSKIDRVKVDTDRKQLLRSNERCWPIINTLASHAPKLQNIINIFNLGLVERPSNPKDFNYISGSQFDSRFEAKKIIGVLTLGLRNNSQTIMIYVFTGESKGLYTTNSSIIDAEISAVDPGLTSKQVKDLLSQIKDLLILRDIRKYPVNNDPNLIACHNGIFDRRSGKLMGFSPKYVIESKIAVNYNPEWKPYLEATLPFKYCKDLPVGMRNWSPLKWFLKLSNGNKERRRTLLQIILELIMTNFSHHKAFYLIGPGGVGKSTFLDVLQNLAGSSNYASLNFDQFDQRFSVSSLINKVADIAHETADSNYMTKTQNYKAIVTGDPINIDIKYQSPYSYTFDNIFLIQAGNAMPKVHDDAGASTRRNIIVRFENKAISRNGDPNIKNDFICRNEFLEWLLCYVVNKTKDFDYFTLSKADHRAMVKQLYANDPVKQFITGIMLPKVRKNPEAIKVLMKRYVYDWYHNWAESLDYNPASEPKFVAQFNSDMNQMGKAPLYVSKRMTISNDDVSALEDAAENDTDGFMPYYRGVDGKYPDYSKKYFAIMRVKNTQQRCFVLNR